MLPLDSRLSATLAARTMQAPCVRHFDDPKRRVGQALAKGLGAESNVAWDVYLFYPKRAEWGANPPQPIRWAHQLDADWADPALYRHGDGLFRELSAALRERKGA